jgi:hypothetical protein
VESYDNGGVTLWSKEDVPPAKKLDWGSLVPAPWEGLMWGILPVSSSLLAILFVVLLPERRRVAETVEFPSRATAQPVFLREAK